MRMRRRRIAVPSNWRRGSFSSSVSNTREALRILARASCTRQTSRLFFKPYSPMSFISPSMRSFSKGRLGVRLVLPWTRKNVVEGIVEGAAGARGLPGPDRKNRGPETGKEGGGGGSPVGAKRRRMASGLP